MKTPLRHQKILTNKFKKNFKHLSIMTLNIQKGQRIDLTKDNPSLKELGIGMGWGFTQSPFDLDVFCLLLDENNQVQHCCYFNELSVLNGAVVHSGDNRDGQGDGDDETIKVKLTQIPDNIKKLLFSVNIYNANAGQNFGMVRDAFIRVYNNETNEELLRYDLSEDYSVFQGINVAEIYRHGSEWKFGAITNGYNGTINDAIATL